MKFISLGLACGLLLAFSAAATTQQSAATQQAAGSQKAAKQTAKLDPDGIVCRNQQVTGSRFSKRICHTREEWAMMESDAKDMKREMDAKPIRSCSDPSCGG
ncbi:MAG: hypothetical protein WBV39_04440 [Rudaea sp.]